MNASIFARDFKPSPFWWDAYEPRPLPEITLPKSVRVAIVGAGYAGLNAALEALLTRFLHPAAPAA